MSTAREHESCRCKLQRLGLQLGCWGVGPGVTMGSPVPSVDGGSAPASASSKPHGLPASAGGRGFTWEDSIWAGLWFPSFDWIVSVKVGLVGYFFHFAFRWLYSREFRFFFWGGGAFGKLPIFRITIIKLSIHFYIKKETSPSSGNSPFSFLFMHK